MIQQWYTTELGRIRLREEKLLLKKSEFKEHYFYINPTTQNLILVVTIRNKNFSSPYVVAIDFPPLYPNVHLYRSVFILAPRLHPSTPHLWSTEGGSPICFIHGPDGLTPKSSVLTVLAKVKVWIVKYEIWLKTGEWI